MQQTLGEHMSTEQPLLTSSKLGTLSLILQVLMEYRLWGRRPSRLGGQQAMAGQDPVHTAPMSQGTPQCHSDRGKGGNSRTIRVQILALTLT